MNLNKNKLREKFVFKSRNRIVVIFTVFIIAIVSMFAGMSYFLPTDSSHSILSGVLYIDNERAMEGIDIAFTFDSGQALDRNGTDAFGNFDIDVTEFIGYSGFLVISYQNRTF